MTAREIAFLIFPDFQVLDLTGPLEVFSQADRHAPGRYALRTLALEPGQVTSSSGLAVVAEAARPFAGLSGGVAAPFHRLGYDRDRRCKLALEIPPIPDRTVVERLANLNIAGRRRDFTALVEVELPRFHLETDCSGQALGFVGLIRDQRFVPEIVGRPEPSCPVFLKQSIRQREMARGAS